MRLVVDTGVFSAALSRRRRAHFDEEVTRLAGKSAVPRSRDGRRASLRRPGRGVGRASRRARLEQAIEATTVISGALLTTVAQVRLACRVLGHPLADRVHANDLWVAASAIHIDTSLLTADNIFHDTPGLTVIS